MAGIGPFERCPRLAVAVSGGPDSLALCLLAKRWADTRGGRVAGLIVDHGLRAASAAEAGQAAAWLAAREVDSAILPWRGPKPVTGIQAAARRARYDLLAGWCRAAGVLHLLLGHQRDEQAETVALRAARGSAADGVAGMAAVRELDGLRVLRPLLDVPKVVLIGFLDAERQPWLDDPSNRTPAFARGRLRAGPALDVGALGSLARNWGAARAARDRTLALWLAAHARIDAAGFVVLDRTALDALPVELAARALQQTLIAVGGGDYPPRRARLARLLAALRAPQDQSGRTLAGCRVLSRAGTLLVCREAGAIVDVLTPAAGVWQRWDRRFVIRALGAVDELQVRALGDSGWRQRSALHTAGGLLSSLPPPVRAGLPALWRGATLLAVPQRGLAVGRRARRSGVRGPLPTNPAARRGTFRAGPVVFRAGPVV